MSRFMALALCFVLPTAAHAASLKDFEQRQDAGESGQKEAA